MLPKKIADQDYIASLLHNLSKKKVPVTVLYKDGQFEDTLTYRKGTLKLKSAHEELSAKKNVKIHFAIQEASFEFQSHSQSNEEIVKPQEIQASFQRLLPRYILENAYLSLDGRTKYKILDINTRGVAFLAETKIAAKEMLHNIQISIGDQEFYCDGKVRHFQENPYIYGVQFINMELPTFLTLFSLITKKTYANFCDLTELTEAQIYKLFHDSGYLDLKARDEMEINFRNMMHALKLLQGKNQVNINPTYLKDNQPLATASLLRIYDRTFHGQSLAAVPQAKMNLRTKLDIYLNIADYTLNSPFCDYYLAYFIADVEWHKEMYQKIIQHINNREKASLDYLHYYEQEVNAVKSLGGTAKKAKVTVLDDTQEFLAFCGRNLPGLEANTYAYNERCRLTELKQLYELLGLFVVRRIWRIRVGRKNAYAVAEVYTNGLNLFNLLDMCRVYFPQGRDFGTDFWEELLGEVAQFYAGFQKTKFSLLFKGNVEDQLALPGLHYLFLCGRVMVNREGIAEYRKFIMTNY